jgi:hypothetical protein
MMNLAAFVPALTLLAAGTPVTLDGMTSPVPAAWKETTTTSPMRVKQFSVPHAAGDKLDAEVIVFFFGPGQGGAADANITRWKAMFDPPAGKKIDDVAKVDTMKIGDLKAIVLDVRGTYKPSAMGPMAPAGEPRPNHRMLSVIFETPHGPYFIRFVGPEKTIERNKQDFERWLKGFKK